MKILSTALLAAGLVALSACGGAATENAAANNVSEEVYNVAPDDLGVDNGLGNEAADLNAADANAADANAVDANAAGNAQ
jgi:hypothetical protein